MIQPAQASPALVSSTGIWPDPRSCPATRGIRGSAVGFGIVASSRAASASPPARSREIGVATEMLVTTGEEVSGDGASAAGLRLKRLHRGTCSFQLKAPVSDGGLAFQFPPGS